MKDILLILTGGTIGSCTANGSIDISGDSKYVIIDKYKEFCEKELNLINRKTFEADVTDRFDVQEKFSILSENSTIEHLNNLIAMLSEIDTSKYNGIIVTHGSDSIPYTANLFGTLLADKIDIPLVIVSSMLSPDVENSDAVYNFAASVGIIDTFIKSRDSRDEYTANLLKDVFAVDGGDIYGAVVHRGIELTEADTANDSYGSYGDEEFGFFYFNKSNTMFLDGDNSMDWMETNYFGTENYYLELNSSHANMCKPNVSKEILDAVLKGERRLPENVLYMKQVPGLNFNFIDISKLKAVLIYGYHAGTFCVNGDGTDISDFIRKCSEGGVSVYLASHKASAVNLYGSVDKLNGLNYTKLYDLSPECAYINMLLSES